MLSLEEIRNRARAWLGSEFNEETRSEVREMLEKDEKGNLRQDVRLVKEVALDISKGLGVLKGEQQAQPVVQISISDQKIAILEDSLRALREPIGELKPTEDR